MKSVSSDMALRNVQFSCVLVSVATDIETARHFYRNGLICRKYFHLIWNTPNSSWTVRLGNDRHSLVTEVGMI